MSHLNTFEEMRRDLGGGQEEALLRKLWLAAGGRKTGKERLMDILREKLAIKLVKMPAKTGSKGRHLRLESMTGGLVLVDYIGHFIQLDEMVVGVDFVEPNYDDFRLIQPEIDTAAILLHLQQFFSGLTFASGEEFERRTCELMEMLHAINSMKNLINGVHFPICLPQLELNDYGEVFEGVFLSAVRRSYEHHLHGRAFRNYREGNLAGRVGIADESRHWELIEKMKHGPVTGIYFPVPIRTLCLPHCQNCFFSLK